MQAAFEALGVVVVVADDAAGAPRLADAVRPTVAENEILVRLPRRVRLTVYELDPGGQLVKRSSSPALVMDGRCPHATVALTKALFGKRAVKLGFSGGSALESLRIGATSGAAAVGRDGRLAARTPSPSAWSARTRSSRAPPRCAAPASTSVCPC